jgi:tetratricopeptide (TPR) repeat protein
MKIGQLILPLLIIHVLIVSSCHPSSRESERMEAALQQADSIYSGGENDTSLFIPNLSEASSYYTDKKQYEKAAIAALYNGYAENSYDKAEAMASFKKAELYGKIVHDSLTVARAQYQMGRLFYNDYMQKAALDLFKNAFAAFGQQYEEKALTLNMTACCFMLLKEYDNASLYIEQSLHYADLGHSNMARRKALNNYAVLYKLKGEYDHAIECLRLVDPENDEQQLLNYLNLGDVFMALGNMDSARYYYGNLKELLDRAKVKEETRFSAYRSLSNYAERNGDLQTAIDLRKEYENLIFSIFNSKNQRNADRIQQKYNYESLQNTMNKKIANRQWIIVIVCGLLLLLTAAIAVLQSWIAVKTKQEAEAKERVLYYIQQYYDTLSKQGETMRKVAIVMENKDDRASLNELSRTVFGKKDPWDAIEEVFYKLHPEEKQNMDRLYPNLTELERKHLILSHFNVSRQDEALLLKINIHSVDKLRQKNKEKLLKTAEYSSLIS